MDKTKKTILWICIVVGLLSIFVLGTIFDLQISKALADLNSDSYLSRNLFAIIGEAFGEDILYVLLVSAFAIIFFNLLKRDIINKNWLKYILLGFCIIASFIISFYCIHKTLSYISEHTSFGLENFLTSALGIIIVGLFSLIVDICAYILFDKLNISNLQQLLWWAILVLFVAAISNVAVQGAKHIFDRTRFRAMHFVGDTSYTYYTPWYQINTEKFNSVSIYAEDFFKSFPSGHTCAAASSAVLVALPMFVEKFNNKKWKTIFWLSSLSYTILVAFSRIVAGAHFFTDVFVGGLITFVCTILTMVIFKYLLLKQKTSKEDKSK